MKSDILRGGALVTLAYTHIFILGLVIPNGSESMLDRRQPTGLFGGLSAVGKR